MKKTRVPKGERYWCIRIFAGIIETVNPIELRESDDNTFFKSGNYFHTREEAEAMAHKLRAVLKGADVIEIPSEEEIINASIDKYPCWCEDGDPHQFVDCDLCSVPEERNCFREGIIWLKSKIVK